MFKLIHKCNYAGENAGILTILALQYTKQKSLMPGRYTASKKYFPPASILNIQHLDENITAYRNQIISERYSVVTLVITFLKDPPRSHIKRYPRTGIF